MQLGDKWHADHIHPYSKDGPTDVLNAQALCPDCNLRKGNSMSDSSKSPRDWQALAFSQFVRDRKRDFLTVATPGSGKTFFGLMIADYLLQSGHVKRIVVVCPTKHIAKQWADKAGEVGINLDPDWANSYTGESSDYHGVALTYQQVDSNSEVSRIRCKRPTLVILDEIHHCADSLSWGDSIRNAFSNATLRLALSGTPFRTDNNPIPFVEYDKAGKSIADFTYTYGESMGQQVCRAVLFPSYEGQIEWFSAGNFITATFRDALSERQQNERLNMALSTKGDWLNQVIAEADQRLSDIRSGGHVDAGGLIICKDQSHARSIANLIEKTIGITPIIAISDDIDASFRIDQFYQGRQRWLVAVKMVSEGVDIPRLRVGIYATNVTTELFFRQAVGRFVRWIDGIEDQSAYFYIPRDERLIQFAQKIKEERDHQLKEEIERLKQEREKRLEMAQVPLISLISSTAIPDDVIYDGDSLAPDDIQHALMLAQRVGLSNVDPAIIAKLLRLHETESHPAETKQEYKPKATPLYKEKQRIRRIVNTQARRIAYKKQEILGLDEPPFRKVYDEINKLDDEYVKLNDASTEQLYRRVEFLTEWEQELDASQ
jgi:superfamily II DNA or RNA helicase